MSNFCGKCGEKFISDEQKFCGACGASRNLNGLKTSEMDLMSVCTQISEKLKEELNDETSKIFQQCLKDVEELLVKERVLLDRFAKELLDREELDYDDIDAIFKEYGKFGISKGI